MPIRTTHNVDDETHVLPVRVHVTATPTKHRLRQPPRLRVRSLGVDIRRHRAAGEVPDADVLRVPLHGIDAAADGVEPIAVRGGVLRGRVEAAADVVVADGTLRVALQPREDLRDGVLDAAVSGVAGDDVLVGGVCALDDVELAAVRPVGTVCPD